MGSGIIVSMDDHGRILIPANIRKKIKVKVFSLELRDDGSILLKPLVNEVLELAGKFKHLLKYNELEELEEVQEKYLLKRTDGDYV